MRKHAILVTGILCLMLSLFSHAEQKATIGQWDIHYIAVNSAFLTPDIARSYGIVRSKYNGLINISVLNSQSQQPVSVVITGTARNLLGVTKPLQFKEVTEGSAIYQLAEIAFRDQEQFQIELSINDGQEQHSFSFQHKFYVDQ